MRMTWNFKNKFIITIVLLLFFALSINTSVLTYIASDKYKNALLSKVSAVGKGMLEEIKFSLNMYIPLVLIEGINDKLALLVSRDQDIAYSMVSDTKGKILFHNNKSMIGKEIADMRPVENASADKTEIREKNKFHEILFLITDMKNGWCCRNGDIQIFYSCNISMMSIITSPLLQHYRKMNRQAYFV